MRTDTNEKAEIIDMQGVASDTLRGALCEMEAVASGTRAAKPFYHASINTRADELLTDAQRMRAIDRLETELGLTGQARVVVVHLKEDREHCHIVWSRIDLERMTAISDSHNYRKHEQVARDLEREFGHERVQGAHIEREGKERPERTPSHDEMLAASRGAATPADARTLITGLWQRTDSGHSFKVALEDEGWILARGDRRDFVAIDPNGGTHSLGRRVEGAKERDVREHMADIDPFMLPSVADARAQQRERQAEQSVAAPAPPLEKERGLDWKEQTTALTARTLPLEAEQGPPPQKDERREFKAEAERSTRRRQDQKATQHARYIKPAREDSGGVHVIDGVTGVVSKLGDFMLDFLSGSAPPQAVSQASDINAFVSDPQDRKAQQLAELAELKAARAADLAIENIRKDLTKGRSLKAEDIRSLTREHQEQIRTFGDSAVQTMIEDARRRGEERERER